MATHSPPLCRGIAEGLLTGDPSAISAAPSAYAAPGLSEAAVLGACGAIVLVVDATEEAPFAEAVDAARRAAAVLVSLAQHRQREATESGLPARPLPALEVFVHKVSPTGRCCLVAMRGPHDTSLGPPSQVDSDGSGGDEGRAELLREVSGALLRELRETGPIRVRCRSAEAAGTPAPPTLPRLPRLGGRPTSRRQRRQGCRRRGHPRQPRARGRPPCAPPPLRALPPHVRL